MGSTLDRLRLSIVDDIAKQSPDPSTKIGCAVWDGMGRLLSYGTNRFPAGVEDTEERWTDRKLKYEIVVHAEPVVILDAKIPVSQVRASTLYVTTLPCCRCAGLIIEAGIGRVVCWKPTEDFLSRWADSVKLSLDLFAEAGVAVTQYRRES